MRGRNLVTVVDFEEVKRLLVNATRQFVSIDNRLKDATAAMRNSEAKNLRETLAATQKELRQIVDLLNVAKDYDDRLRQIIGDAVEVELGDESTNKAPSEVITDANAYKAEVERIAKVRDPLARLDQLLKLVVVADEVVESAEHRIYKLKSRIAQSKADTSDGSTNERSNAKKLLESAQSSLPSLVTRKRNVSDLAKKLKKRIDSKLVQAETILKSERGC